jgi:hypothetical protein
MLIQFQLLAFPSWRADAVEATRKIRPLGIAERKETIGERVGLEQNPSGIGQTDAGFHHGTQMQLAKGIGRVFFMA